MSYQSTSLEPLIARRALRGLGDSAPCPDGTHAVCMISAPGAPPGACVCQPNKAPPLVTQAGTTLKYKWGILAGGVIAGLIVYKVATG